MSTLQLEWTPEELLATHKVVEPLVAGGVKCHGGYDDNGQYVSPRTLNRWTAIENWQQSHRTTFGTDILDIPLDRWPENYPNVAQAKFLVANGVREPIVSTLTRIGTVEGFGAMIRYSEIPNLQQCFDDDVRGTALTHLDKGMFEAHARDEAGYGDEGGHKQMWFAARDVAFEDPINEDQTEEILQRMGFSGGGPGGGAPNPQAIRAALEAQRAHSDIPFALESLMERMSRLLLIEISAYHVFAWAEEVLSDTDLVAGEGEAAKLVSHIRSDEGPHVAYLKTTLTEMRDRTFVGESGKRYPGTKIVGEIWDRAIADSLGARREQNLQLTLREVEHALKDTPKAKDILEEFHSLGSIRPSTDGSFVAAQPASY